MFVRRLLPTVALALVCLAAPAADYYVDWVRGNDDWAGDRAEPAEGSGPFRTCKRALAAAGAGDTVHLVPRGEPLREMVNFYGHKGGEEGRPLVFDGHGATISGAEPMPPEAWQPRDDGIFERDDVLPHGFIVINGEMVFEGPSLAMNLLQPGEFHYAPYHFNQLLFCVPAGFDLKASDIEVGQPDGTSVKLDGTQWQLSHSTIKEVRRYLGLKPVTWVKIAGQDAPLVGGEVRLPRLQPGMWAVEAKKLYFRPTEGLDPRRTPMLGVVRANGVQLNGTTAWVTIRNLNAEHVYNDGYNIHGNVTHAEFYNCNARQTGDEGFSAHGECETLLDGAAYDQNDNGIANVNNAGSSITRNVVLRRARHVGYLLESRGTARHEITNAILIDNPAQFNGSTVTADNVLIVQTPSGPGCNALGLGRESRLSRFTVLGNRGLLRADAGMVAALDRVVFGPGQGPIHVRADDPTAILRLTQSRFAADLVVEWGSRYPWKRQPIGEWLAAVGAPAAVECQALPVEQCPTVAAVLAGAALPEGGCDPALAARLREVLAAAP